MQVATPVKSIKLFSETFSVVASDDYQDWAVSGELSDQLFKAVVNSFKRPDLHLVERIGFFGAELLPAVAHIQMPLHLLQERKQPGIIPAPYIVRVMGFLGVDEQKPLIMPLEVRDDILVVMQRKPTEWPGTDEVFLNIVVVKEEVKHPVEWPPADKII